MSCYAVVRVWCLMRLLAVTPLCHVAITLTGYRSRRGTAGETTMGAPHHGYMVAERWFQLEACQALDQRSRRRRQQREQARDDDERIQQIETLGRMRARNGRSRRDEVMRKYLENRRSLAKDCRHCSIAAPSVESSCSIRARRRCSTTNSLSDP
mmetsp:Transcript_76585/g.215387  ORF Transcript_76585/g.215387 Transcript_76585/m.215387 type:complete len:154 (+) Transcript_76585:135-596(+)